MTTTATAKREAATQPPQPPQPQQRSPGFLASIHQPILSPRSTNPPTNTTPAVDKSNNEDNFLLTPRPLTGIDYEEGQDGRKGVVGNDHGTNDGTDDDDDDVSSIAMSVSVSDVSSQMEMEDDEMVEMATDTVIDESNTTENTISIDEQMIGWFGGRRDGTTLRIPPIPVGDGICVFQCDRGYNLSLSACQLQINDIKQ